MTNLASEVARIVREVDSLLADPSKARQRAMPGGAYFLENGDVLALPRDNGDSRYPYGEGGFNFWACASGYMHCNEGLFSLLLRAAEGQEPKIAFFAGLPRKSGLFMPVPLLQVPLIAGGQDVEARRYTVLTPSAAYYVTECGGLRFVLRAFVTADHQVCFSLHAENRSGKAQELFLSSFINPYLRHQIYETGEDRWFKEVRVLKPARGQTLGSFLVLVNEDRDRHRSVTRYGVIRRGLLLGGGSEMRRREETTSRSQYVGGARSSLHTPAALFAGTFGKPQPVCTFTETAVAADLVHLDLPRGGVARLDWVFICTADGPSARSLAAAREAGEAVDADLHLIKSREAARRKGMSARVDRVADRRVKPAVFNAFFEHLKKQVEFCSLIKGYVHLSENSLIGVRDVFQALEGLAFWQAEPAREKMLEALGYTAPDGRCFRQYSLPNSEGQAGRMDLRPFIDQGAWAISCAATYLRLTGDWEFLDEICGYHDIVDEAARKVAPSPLTDTVLEHLLKITDYLVRHRDPETRCVLALYGDWNDALDGLGISRDPAKAYGTGVSVMATLQVYQNLEEMIEILGSLGGEPQAARIEGYRQAAQEIEDGLRRFAVVENGRGERKIVHGWGDGRSYLVGGFSDPDGQARDGLTSNAFWVLSGLYERDPSIRPTILKAFKRLDSKYGFKTFEPFFPPDTPGVGRIGKLPPGTAENGAAYVHATLFAVMALFRMGCAKEAWEQLIKVLPFTDLHANLSHSAFVMPNSYGLNEEKFIDGQNMNDWQTGSANVLLKLLVRHVFGFEPALKGAWIQPASPSPFKSFEFNIRVRQCDVRVVLRDRGREQRLFAVNGDVRTGTLDAVSGVVKLWLPWAAFQSGRLEVQVEQ